MFSALQVLVMITHTLCTQRTTVICLVQATSRNSVIGPHISKHWCRSCEPTACPPALRVFPRLIKISFSLQAFLLTSSCLHPAVYVLSWPLKQRNKRGRADREYCSVSHMVHYPLCSACWDEDPVPSQALPLSSSLHWVHCGSVTRWNDTKLTPQLTE